MLRCHTEEYMVNILIEKLTCKKAEDMVVGGTAVVDGERQFRFRALTVVR